MSMMKQAQAVRDKLLAEQGIEMIERVFNDTAGAKDGTDVAAVHFGARLAALQRYRDRLASKGTATLVDDLLAMNRAYFWEVPHDTLTSVVKDAIVGILEMRYDTDEWLDEFMQTHEHSASDPATANREYFTAWTEEVMRQSESA